jgi:hypothetical protein
MQTLIIILLGTTLLTFFIVTFVFHLFYKRILEQLQVMGHWIHLMQKDIKDLNIAYIDLRHDFDTTYSSISKLNNNVAAYLNQEEQRRNETFIMPKPDLSKVIDESIREQIIMEATLAKGMRIPQMDLVHRISEAIEKTYPNVDKDYLGKKILCKVEEFNETAYQK